MAVDAAVDDDDDDEGTEPVVDAEDEGWRGSGETTIVIALGGEVEIKGLWDIDEGLFLTVSGRRKKRKKMRSVHSS